MSSLDADDLVLAVIDACNGTVKGRTVLQKLAYLVSESMGVNAGYQPHYYGPYSEKVAAAVRGQISRGLLNETPETFDNSGFAAHDFPHKRYTYKLGRRGREAFKWRRAQAESDFDKVGELVGKLMETSPDYRVLSYAAKLHLILCQTGEAMTREATRRYADREYGWEMSDEEMKAGAELLLNVGLITESEED